MGRFPTLDKQKWHNIEIVVDRIKASKEEKSRLFESVQNALKAGKGSVLISGADERIFSQNNACSYCGITIGELEPKHSRLIPIWSVQDVSRPWSQDGV